MGFEFNDVGELSAAPTLVCFLCVIVFIVLFEYVIGITEFVLEESKLYHEMMQMIYKELMLMGLVSFTVIMLEASDVTSQDGAEEWLVGVDFAHILIFYVTFFLVAHAFFLLRTSIISSRKYRRMFYETAESLLTDVSQLRKNRVFSGLYNFVYLPLSSSRENVEFYMIHQLFRDIYWLPKEFNFPAYVSGCFDRYALKTIKRSLFSWLALFILVLLNYFRILAGFGCKDAEEADVGAARRLHESSSHVVDWRHPRVAYYQSVASVRRSFLSLFFNASIAPISDNINGTGRVLASELGDDATCNVSNVEFFLFCGALLCMYALLLVIVTSIVKQRFATVVAADFMVVGPVVYLCCR